MLKNRSIQSIYNNRIILEDINLTLKHGEATAGIGSNAAGTAAVLNRAKGNVLAEVGVVNYSF